jgi:hypothetical protein
MKDNHIFTPQMKDEDGNWYRGVLFLSSKDFKKVAPRRNRWSTTITDMGDSKQYEVKGVPCGICNCYCDAIVVALDGKNE